jgi:hypothetical protein
LWSATCLISGSGLLLTHCWLFCLSSCLFTESSHGDQFLAPPPLSNVLSAAPPLCCVSFRFLVYCSFFWGEGSLPRGLCWFIPGVPGGILHDAWCSPDGLPNVCKQVWSQSLAVQQPSCFLSVTWHGEAFHRLGKGVQGVKALFLLAALFPPSVAPAPQQGFGVTELMLSASAPQLPSWISPW